MRWDSRWILRRTGQSEPPLCRLQTKVPVERLGQGVAPAAPKAWAFQALWKAKVILAALAGLVVPVAPTPRVGLAVLMARTTTTRVALVSWAALESRERWDQQPWMLPVWRGQLQGQGEMRQQRP